MKHISRSAGRSATAAAAYRSAERIHDERTGRTHDYSNKRGVLSSVILAPSRAPEWARQSDTLWNKVEHTEKRKDSRLARENIVALPHELTLEQNVDWLHQFINDNYVKRGMAAQVSIHGPDQHGDQRNYHAHILLTTRAITRNGFKEKKPEKWNEKATLFQWREEFAKHQNRALERHGHRERVDHRSYKNRGIDREPTQHLGPEANQIEREDKSTAIGEKNRLAKEFNRNLDAMKEQERQLHEQIKLEQQREAERKQHERSRKEKAPVEHQSSEPAKTKPEPTKQKSLPDSLRPKPVPSKQLKRPENFRQRLDAERALRDQQDCQREALKRENEQFYKRKETEAKLRQTQRELQKQNKLWGKITGKQKKLAEQARVLKLNLENKKQREQERVDALERKLREEQIQRLGPDKPKQNVRREFRKAVREEAPKPAPTKLDPKREPSAKSISPAKSELSRPKLKPDFKRVASRDEKPEEVKPEILRARTAAHIVAEKKQNLSPAKSPPPLIAREPTPMNQMVPPQKTAPTREQAKSVTKTFNAHTPPKPPLEQAKTKDTPVLRASRPGPVPDEKLRPVPGVRKEPPAREPKKDRPLSSERDRRIDAFKERIKQRRERSIRNRGQDRSR